MFDAPDVTLIIPQYQHPELTIACVRSLRATDPIPWHVIIVDDGSPHAADLPVELADSHCTFIRQSRAGVTAAWNRGARAASTPFLVFLNNDVLCSGPWVAELVAPLRDAACCLTGIHTRRETALPADVLARLPSPEFLQGWCFGVRTDDFIDLGGFDERLQLYWSDTDLQARLRRHVDPARATWRTLPPAFANNLRHLGHRTAHDRRCMQNARAQWQTDRDTFINIWRET